MTRIFTPSEDTLRKIRDDHFTLMRLIEDMQQRLHALDGSEDSGWVLFLNSSGEQVPRGGVMRITDFSKTTLTATIGKPNTTFQREYLVNAGVPVSDGGTGVAYRLGGICEALYASGTPALNEEWGAANGAWTLTQNRPGFLVRGWDTTALTVFAKPVLAQVVVGKADAAISNGASGTVRVYGGAHGSTTDTSQTIASCYNYGPDIADEADVAVSWPNGKPVVSLLNCP